MILAQRNRAPPCQIVDRSREGVRRWVSQQFLTAEVILPAPEHSYPKEAKDEYAARLIKNSLNRIPRNAGSDFPLEKRVREISHCPHEAYSGDPVGSGGSAVYL
jgi:hypothetical protein